jgi:hypothetical protein
MVSAHKEVNHLPRTEDDNYECMIILLMVWSDVIQLANFSDASLWLVYLYFGNQSKYIRGKPTSRACHHVAYIPSVSSSYPKPVVIHVCYVVSLKLPDNFQDIYTQAHKEVSSHEMYTYFKQELMHAIWKLLWDRRFVEAYKTGLLIECVDHVDHRFFTCFFSYSANYPEK